MPHDDNNAWQDQGRQERTFWLLGGRGGYAELALDRRAEELQTPAEYVMDSVHHGSEPWERTFLEIMPENVWVLAIKRAENEDATVIRIQERAGKSTLASIKSAHLGLDHNVSLAPWELKTLLVMRAKGHAKVREVSYSKSNHVAPERGLGRGRRQASFILARSHFVLMRSRMFLDLEERYAESGNTRYPA